MMLSNIGRAALRRVGGGATKSTNRALQTIWCVKRVDNIQTPGKSLERSQFTVALKRSYATNSNIARKPKSAPTAKTKPKVGTKKPVKKPLKKTPTKKTVKAKKAKPKTAKKSRPVKPLTEDQKLKAKVKELKGEALLNKPKGKPSNVWTLVLAEHMQAQGPANKDDFKTHSAEASARYKSLTPEELEAYNHRANQNKAANEKASHDWLTSHTPDAIRIANNARIHLKRLGHSSRYPTIQDERLPKRPSAARIFFQKERFASGDLKGISLGDSMKVILKEWNELNPDAKKPYEDASKADRQRYVQEFKTVYHRDSLAKIT